MSQGGSAHQRAQELRAQAAQARDAAATLEAQAGAWEAGAAGEHIVANELATLPPGWHVLHDRLLNPGKSQANLDHLVISEAGVFFIDAKLWAGNITVHEDSLWQHTYTNGVKTASKSKTSELEKIAGMAASMAKHLDGPVVPVLALANKRTRRFDTTTVRGVHILPASALTDWLTAQPPIVAKPDVEGLRLKVDLAFPPAGNGTRDNYQYTTLPGMPARTSTRTEARPAPARTRRRFPWRALLGLTISATVLIAGIGNGKTLLTQFGLTTPTYTLLDGTPAPKRACDAITATDIHKAVGKKVYPDPNQTASACNWYFTPPTGIGRIADLTITTGRPAHAITSTLTKPQATAGLGTATYQAPQHVRVPGSTATAAQITQPFAIAYRYTGGTRASDAQATKTVTRLAVLLANRLPQGQGADHIPTF